MSTARANGVAIDLPTARRFALRVVAAQAVVTVIVALLSWALAGPNGARSALLGGGIGTVANLAMALLSFGSRSGADAHYAMRAFLVGEAVKLGLVVVLFVVVLKVAMTPKTRCFSCALSCACAFWRSISS